jgi:hypothetical protein
MKKETSIMISLVYDEKAKTWRLKEKYFACPFCKRKILITVS